MSFENMLERRKEAFVRNHLLSDEFLDFIQQNTIPFETLISYYRCAIMEVETKFRVLSEELSLQYDRNPIESIKSRVKSRDSLLRKIRKRELPLSLEAIEENIFDIAGVRVICSFLEDIYAMEKALLQQDDVKLIERKDYIKNPKPSGYRSLHLIIEIPIFLQHQKKNMKVEVQLRTSAMDFWASAEHKLRYKKTLPEEKAALISQELEQAAEVCAILDQRMQMIKDEIDEAEELKDEVPMLPEPRKDEHIWK